MSNAEVYQEITDRMIAQLKKGTIPWEKPWTAAAGGHPMRMSENVPYRGVNTLILSLAAQEKGYTSPWWGTYDQIAEKAGMERHTNPRTDHTYWVSPDGTPRGVRKGETSTRVVLWKTGTKKEINAETGEREERPVLLARMYPVFNTCQAEQLPDRYHPGRAPAAEPAAEIREPQDVLDGYVNQPGGPALRHVNGDGAHYDVQRDEIVLPEREQFQSLEAYYSGAFHEAGHSTGHPGRLNREGIADFDHFGSQRYAREELVAQMTSAMLQAETGIETPQEWDRSAAYVANWLGALEKDPTLVPQAASAAQKAVDQITEPQRQAERDTHAGEPQRQAEQLEAA